ncbi:MAG: DNA polymerase III subunit delta, partial [Clostridia bacterium]|nr:DNA polymerase III subunit delta [Clostridia bacterium]
SEARIFALSDCVVRNDFNAAYQQLHRLLEQNEKPEIILSVLSSAFIDMYRMKMASESGVTAAQVAADFKYGKREFLLRNAANNAKKYSAATLRNILNIILDTDIKLKSTRASSRILLETLLSELMLAMKEGSQ